MARQWDWGLSSFGACALCGCGEAGAEHLLIWCPAVALAWRTLGGRQGRPLASAIAVPGDDDALIARLPH